ncbi:MAG TPA: PBP1A family penicillin-binding protein [Thermodesulfobacteriota bacterium]
MRRVVGYAALAVGLAAIALGIQTFYLYTVVTGRLEAITWKLPSKVFAAPVALYPGVDVARLDLAGKLRRLNYRPAPPTGPLEPGQYRRGPTGLDLYLHDTPYPGRPDGPSLVRLELAGQVVTNVLDPSTGDELAVVELEPELITELFDTTREDRTLVTFDQLPAALVDALVAIEDRRFYQHFGLDWRGIARAAYRNLRAWRIAEGGSTLTQQLVKNVFLTEERTFLRKVNEAIIAVMLERRYSKRQILEFYANEVYLGQAGPTAIHGFGEAARHYFGKDVSKLTVGESALLAGMVRAPNALNPAVNPKRAKARRNVVLERMLDVGVLTKADYLAALSEPVDVKPAVVKGNDAPYFVDFLRAQLHEIYPREVLTSEGLRVYTTLDLDLQHRAQAALDRGLERLERQYPKLRRDDPAKRLQGAVIVLSPQTGAIRAMVGGREYGRSQFNRATQARRQPGSTFKPILYAAAFSPGENGAPPPFTPATMVDDTPLTLKVGDTTWRPVNYDRKFRGRVSVRTAIEQSLNASAVRVALETGLARVIATARALGIESPLKEVPALALGASEVTVLEMASAYATLANSGLRSRPIAVRDVTDRAGTVIERRAYELETALPAEVAYVVTHVLEGVLDRGTGASARRMGLEGAAAGKSGTTSDYRDAWFAGYTPEAVVIVWVGFDDGTPINLTGSQAALPIWVEIMREAQGGRAAGPFPVPPGVTLATIDPATGFLATTACPDRLEEAFVAGTEPTGTCPIHPGAAVARPGERGGLIRWIKELFR